MIAFFFACYGGGCPQYDEFSPKKGNTTSVRREIAPNSFLARLPQKLLSHPKGGALAVIAHIDRAWGYSFTLSGKGVTKEQIRQIAVFQSSVKRLLEGHPVGSALEFFDERYAEISSDLTTELENIELGDPPNHASLADMWTSNNDARNYAIIGDPAVRLVVSSSKNASTARPTMETVHLPASLEQKPAESSAGSVAGEIDLKQAQTQLISSLEQFIKSAESVQTATSIATNLLNVLKGLK